ncbi:hypothetical protein RHO15_06450 [Utexia brackfieldae]|uniref:hypothetical protein n=1 Tax=Utexia brackfieldae TaxID=3074108 RepID=UPI00370D19D8
MINKVSNLFFHLKLLIFNIIRGIVIFFVTAVVAIIVVRYMGYMIDWDLFFSFEYIYKVIVGGGLMGIAAWWIKMFGSGSKKDK